MVHFLFDIRNEYFIQYFHAFQFNFDLEFETISFFFHYVFVFQIVINKKKKKKSVYDIITAFTICECLHFHLKDIFQIKFDVKNKYT